MIKIRIGDRLAALSSISPDAAKGTPGRYLGTDSAGKKIGVEVLSRLNNAGQTATTVNQWDVEGGAHGTSYFLGNGAESTAFVTNTFVRTGDLRKSVLEQDDNLDGHVDVRWTSVWDNAKTDGQLTVERARPDESFEVVYPRS